MGCQEFIRHRAEGKNPGMVREISVQGEDIVKKNRLVPTDLLPSRPLPDGPAHSFSAGRRSKIARPCCRSSGKQVSPIQFAAEHAHPHKPLMTKASGVCFQLSSQRDFRLSFPDQLCSLCSDTIGTFSCGSNFLNLVGRLDTALQPDSQGDVRDFCPWENPFILAKKIDREDIELHCQPVRQRTMFCNLSDKLPGAANGNDMCQGRFAAGPVKILKDHQQRLTFDRLVEIPLLRCSGVIKEIGLLDNQCAVKTASRKFTLQSGLAG